MYLGNHAYKIASKQMIDYLDNLINALLWQNIDEGTGPTKSNSRKECMIWHYWFFNHGFRFQYFVCNDCHDFIILCLNIKDITIITVKNVDYRCIVHNSKSEAFSFLKNPVLENREYIWKILP